MFRTDKTELGKDREHLEPLAFRKLLLITKKYLSHFKNEKRSDLAGAATVRGNTITNYKLLTCLVIVLSAIIVYLSAYYVVPANSLKQQNDLLYQRLQTRTATVLDLADTNAYLSGDYEREVRKGLAGLNEAKASYLKAKKQYEDLLNSRSN